MRTLLVLLGIFALVLVLLMAFGMISVGGGRMPTVAVDGGKAPQVDVGRIAVGSENQTVQVPTIDVERAGNAQ
jgi:hypothetical protein